MDFVTVKYESFTNIFIDVCFMNQLDTFFETEYYSLLLLSFAYMLMPYNNAIHIIRIRRDICVRLIFHQQ